MTVTTAFINGGKSGFESKGTRQKDQKVKGEMKNVENSDTQATSRAFSSSFSLFIIHSSSFILCG
jgi:hypothetical protein